MDEIPEDVKIAAIDAALVGSGEHITFSDVARAILAERKRCAGIATAELRNTGQLLTSPPMSSAAWDIRNAIESGQ